MLEKRREYGVLKAIGARGGQMATVVVIQALLVASLVPLARISRIDPAEVFRA